MEKFAKLYESELTGQILVLNDTNDDGDPTVRFTFQPKGLGLCSIGQTFKNTDEGCNHCDEFFNSVDEDLAVTYVTDALRALGMIE